MSLFSAVEMAPRDPILGLNEAFNADTRTTKVNLGVGVYYNEEGRIPLLRAVAEAEKARIEAHAPRGYLPIEGIAAYDKAVQELLFGKGAALIEAGRVITTQALGGTGALKIGADFLKAQSEGIMLKHCADGSGWWITTEQGKGQTVFHLFDRQSLAHVGAVTGKTVANTDGIWLHDVPTTRFPDGVLYAVHDDQGMVAFDWAQIAKAAGLPACGRGA